MAPERHPIRANGGVESKERPCRLSVLGATGSIGSSTLDLVAHHAGDFEIVALTAQSKPLELAACARRHGARVAVIGDPALYGTLKDALAGSGIKAAAGEAALAEAAAEPADCVMAAIVGAAGLRPTFAAVAQGRRIALANKECLVSAGDVFLREIKRHGAELVPVDSEHSAVFQILAGSGCKDVEKITLTASGGPFRTWDQAALDAATPEQALRHPNWSMGAKITIDSATLMNKGLELIEASYLFNISPDLIEIVVHPESTIHSLVHYVDGSVLAQLAAPDMRIPIAHTLAWPDRATVSTARLSLAAIGTLTFEAPDTARFPALGLCRGALKVGPAAAAALSAANEVAVEAFLAGRIRFLDICRIVEDALGALEALEPGLIVKSPTSFDEVAAVDTAARRAAHRIAGSLAAA